jgi:hypothetical protein
VVYFPSGVLVYFPSGASSHPVDLPADTPLSRYLRDRAPPR